MNINKRITNLFNLVCQFRYLTPGIKGNSFTSNDVKVLPIQQNLKQLGEDILSVIDLPSGSEIEIKWAKGSGNFPHIPWVTFLPPNQSTSDGIYVAVCFDKFGNGALVGCGESSTNPKFDVSDKVMRKTNNKDELSIDVDGGKPNVNYNNAFINPKEFKFPLLEEDVENFIAHIRASIELATNNSKAKKFISLRKSQTKENKKYKLQNVLVREKQQQFKSDLVSLYKVCVVTGCDVHAALDGAHIEQYKGSVNTIVSNGLLLRTDLHRLFDRGLWVIEPITNKIELSPILLDSIYKTYEGKVLKISAEQEKLQNHFNTFRSWK